MPDFKDNWWQYLLGAGIGLGVGVASAPLIGGASGLVTFVLAIIGLFAAPQIMQQFATPDPAVTPPATAPVTPANTPAASIAPAPGVASVVAPSPASSAPAVNAQVEQRVFEHGIEHHLPVYLLNVAKKNGVEISKEEMEKYNLYTIRVGAPSELRDAVTQAYKDTALRAKPPQEAAETLMKLPESQKFIDSFEPGKRDSIRKDLQELFNQSHPSFVSGIDKAAQYRNDIGQLANTGNGAAKMQIVDNGRTMKLPSEMSGWIEDTRKQKAFEGRINLEGAFVKNNGLSISTLVTYDPKTRDCKTVQFCYDKNDKLTDVELVVHKDKRYGDRKSEIRHTLSETDARELQSLIGSIKSKTVDGERYIDTDPANLDKLTKLLDKVSTLEVGKDKQKVKDFLDNTGSVAPDVKAKVLHHNQVQAIEGVLRHELKLESLIAPDGKTAPGLNIGGEQTVLQKLLVSAAWSGFGVGVMKGKFADGDVDGARRLLKSEDADKDRMAQVASFKEAALKGAKANMSDPYRGAAEALHDTMREGKPFTPDQREKTIKDLSGFLKEQSEPTLRSLMSGHVSTTPPVPDEMVVALDQFRQQSGAPLARKSNEHLPTIVNAAGTQIS